MNGKRGTLVNCGVLRDRSYFARESPDLKQLDGTNVEPYTALDERPSRPDHSGLPGDVPVFRALSCH